MSKNDNIKRVNLKLDPALHASYKKLCDDKRRTIQAMTEKLIKRYVKKAASSK